MTTKIHLAADPRCRPLVLLISPGQSGGAPHFPLLIDALQMPRPVRRPRTGPEAVLPDKAYSSKRLAEAAMLVQGGSQAAREYIQVLG